MEINFLPQFEKGVLVILGIYQNGELACLQSGNCFTERWEGLKKLGQNLALKEGATCYCQHDQENVLFIGLGEKKQLTSYEKRCLGGRLWSVLGDLPWSTAQLCPWFEGFEEVLYGLSLRDWGFHKYRQKRPVPGRTCQALLCISTDKELERKENASKGLVQSVHWARELGHEPANILYPQTFVQRLEQLKELGIEVDVLDKKALEEKGFGALLGVGQGSVHPPYLVTLHWKGTSQAAAAQDPVVLVGKGVTFDTGGISIKPSRGMEEMKADMSGAAVVTATVRAAALTKLDRNVVAIVPLVENAVSGGAQRPGDIVTSLSGQTIEVLDTDAEGRLILADALWYAQERYKPTYLIDVATLTGAIRISLANEFAGVFSMDEALVQELKTCGTEVGEKLWHMPLHKAFDEAMNSEWADMQNIAPAGYGAGSSTAAEFLKRFVKSGQKWAHLDIANVDMAPRDTALCPKGPSAFGVQLLYHWLKKDARS